MGSNLMNQAVRGQVGVVRGGLPPQKCMVFFSAGTSTTPPTGQGAAADPVVPVTEGHTRICPHPLEIRFPPTMKRHIIDDATTFLSSLVAVNGRAIFRHGRLNPRGQGRNFHAASPLFGNIPDHYAVGGCLPLDARRGPPAAVSMA